MYEARQNKEKVNRRIDVSDVTRRNGKVEDVEPKVKDMRNILQLSKDDNFSSIMMVNHRIYHCSQRATANGIRNVLQHIGRREFTLVISGTHGDEYGETAATDPSLTEDEFFTEDEQIILELGIQERTTLISAKYLDAGTLSNIINTGDFGGVHYDNVVLAYCHGRRTYI